MKKFLLWVAGISLLSLLIGLVIIKFNGGFHLKIKDINVERTVESTNTKTLEISSTSANINVEKGDENNITVRYHGQLRTNSSSEPEVLVDRDNEKLSIKSGTFKPEIGFTTYQNFQLDVIVPSTLWEELKIKSVSGDISATDLSANKFNIESTSGNLSLTNCSGGQILKTVSGNIKLLDRELAFDKTINTTSGDVNLFLPAKGDYSIAFNTVSGEISNSLNIPLQQTDKRHMTAKVGDGKYMVSVDSVSGDLIF